MVKVGDRINVWIAGDGPTTFRAEVAATRFSKYGIVPVAVRIVAPSGQLSTPLLSGTFVVIHDQSKPEWEK